ncbi:uncharacterized protein LTR77_010637 [Saxophila tyrrhenica]|uniref:Major facilitator superfamily (MFS) profile domain-containing protein n=1 Tax=Saxophila tyrrhenica TaxID=1690608 RepID=A0AAV9NWI7_9PEZI|nr:hypothetical protein LTR77_010637 [Saxophila tyrrhenica]
MAPPNTTKDKQDQISFLERFQYFNGILVFIMVYMAFCAFNFGFDVGTFSGVQAMAPFVQKFGHYDAQSDEYVLAGWLRSIMTATPFIGKALGAISCGMIAERWGRRAAILGLCIVSFIGVALQTSAVESAQFTIGRIITYAMTGMAVVVVPIYQSEVAPPQLRGMFASTIQGMIVLGQVIAAVISYGTQRLSTDAAWQIPIGLQLVMPGLIFVLLPILPESPRWLLSQDRYDDAAKNMRKLRKKATEEEVSFELESLRHVDANSHKGSWAEVFDSKNRLRTGIAVFAMFGQQITGQAFPSQYGVVFYQSQGYASESFLFNIVQNIVSLVAVLLALLVVDSMGRRTMLLCGGSLMGVFMLILGGLGTNPNTLSQSGKDTMVASLMLFQFFFNISWAPVAYVVVSEAAASRVKEKTNLLAIVVSVLTTFVTSFTVPYLINEEYANLGGKLGYIYGGINVLMVIGVFFIIPELKNRSLEEVDQLFASGAPLRTFSKITTQNAEQLYEKDALSKPHGVVELREDSDGTGKN